MKHSAAALLALAALAGPAPALAQKTPDHARTADARPVTATRPVLYQRNSGIEQTEQISRTLKVGSAGEIELSNIAGDIVVTRGSGNEAKLEVRKVSRGRTAEDAREMLALVDVEITERGNLAEIQTEYPDHDSRQRGGRRNINVTVYYTLTAPANTRLTVHSISGGIKVSDIKGDLALETISGSVEIRNAGRISSAKSASGDVTILDTQVDGGIEASSVSGTVSARNVKARRLTLESISGNAVMEDVASERVEGSSISGNVLYSGALARGSRYELTSHSGEVRLAVAGSSGFQVEANSFSGSVRSELELTMRANDSPPERSGRRRSIRGVMGDGGANVEITTFSGNVLITKR